MTERSLGVLPERRLEIRIPGEPRAKGRPRAFVQRTRKHPTGHVQVYTDQRTIQHENWIRSCALEAMRDPKTAGGLTFPFEGPLTATVLFFLPRPKTVKRRAPSVKPDLSNLLKAVEDGLQLAGVYRDDCQVVSLVAAKAYVDQGREPFTSVVIVEGTP